MVGDSSRNLPMEKPRVGQRERYGPTLLRRTLGFADPNIPRRAGESLLSGGEAPPPKASERPGRIHQCPERTSQRDRNRQRMAGQSGWRRR